MRSIVKYGPTIQTALESATGSVDSRIHQLKPKKLPPMPRTRDLLHIYGIRAKSNMSQNFLLNQRLLNGLVRAAGIMPGHRVVEIGPGPGNLTRTILERSPFEVLVVEKDRRFLPLLEQLSDSVLPGQLKIYLGDALEHDLDKLFGDPAHIVSEYKLPEDLPHYLFNFGRDWSNDHKPLIRLIGNLPFSVSTPLLIKWLSQISLKQSVWQYGRVPMLLTFQEEVARRIVAEPTSSERTRLSAMSQNYCQVDYKFTISGKSFTPMAGVDTGVVRFVPRKKPYCDVPFKLFEKFIRHLFHHRNHTLDYNYKTLFPRDMHDTAHESFRKAGVNYRIHPFMISNSEIARLCNEYYEHCQRVPPLIEYNYRASKRLLSQSEMEVLAAHDLLTKISQ